MDKTRILIVEDEAVISLGLCEVLGLVGLDVVGVAANVTDALCIAENTHPDVAIFDIHLQGQRDGIEGARLLRQRFNVPVVFLTANNDQDMRARASEVEPAAYLTKPVHPKRLIAAIESALRALRAKRATSSK
jgi:two-component system, response regulator PdtaR